MERLLVCLALVMATFASHGAEVDATAIAAKHFDAWFEENYPLLRTLPPSESSDWSAPVDRQWSCVGKQSWKCKNESLDGDFRDRKGLKRDTYYFLGYQVASIGILYVLPESISSWSDEDKEDYSLSKWWHNVTHPTWDDDDFFLNYVTHPYWGAAYFVRARERGYTNRQSFWYSAMLSSMYEFGAEALFEPASIQDLIVTPIAGSLLGRYFMSVRGKVEDRTIERGYRTTKDKWLLALTDPLGAINRQVDGWLGLQADLQLRPYVRLQRRNRDATIGRPQWAEDREIGVAFSLRW